MVALISVVAYPFLAFVRPDNVPPDSKETKLGSSDQEASPSAGKNTGVVLVPCSRMKVRPYSYFRWCGYF